MNFKDNDVNVLSFWSDEFETRREYINETIDLFLNDDKIFDAVNSFSFEFLDDLSNEALIEYEHRCLSFINKDDKFILIKNKNEILGILKYVFDNDIMIINDISHFKLFNFKDSLKSFMKKFSDYEIEFLLDNRLMPYYDLWLCDVEFEKYIEPRFHRFYKGRSVETFDDISMIDFDKEDVIWCYGQSLFRLDR